MYTFQVKVCTDLRSCHVLTVLCLVKDLATLVRIWARNEECAWWSALKPARPWATPVHGRSSNNWETRTNLSGRNPSENLLQFTACDYIFNWKKMLAWGRVVNRQQVNLCKLGHRGQFADVLAPCVTPRSWHQWAWCWRSKKLFLANYSVL